MKARAVIGANFGDEGKGLVTDYLARQGGDVVVRFNGGAQAGHTVVTPNGRRHIFSHFGSGSFAGLPTFFSQHTIVNPIMYYKERPELMDVATKIYVHGDALVTTPWDMNANQARERMRDKQHGSCGVGLFETVKRNQTHPLTMRCLWDCGLEGKINAIRNHYCSSDEDLMGRFFYDCLRFADAVSPATILKWSDPLFEGAQGLLLDQGNMAMFPHLTPSRCGLHNVRELVWQGGLELADVYYVSRTYLTRHGNGPLPGEDPKLFFVDTTNRNHEWQGPLRFAPLNRHGLLRRIHADHSNPKLVLTHCDQLEIDLEADLYAYGEVGNCIYSNKEGVRNDATPVQA